MLPGKLKIARVSSIYKAGGSSDLTNYRPTSALPSFSKILERIIYNLLFYYFSKKDFYIRNNSVFNLLFYNQKTKFMNEFMNFFKIICIVQGFFEFHKVQYWDHFCSYFMLMKNALKILYPITFADDTNLFADDTNTFETATFQYHLLLQTAS